MYDELTRDGSSLCLTSRTGTGTRMTHNLHLLPLQRLAQRRYLGRMTFVRGMREMMRWSRDSNGWWLLGLCR